MRCFKLLFMGAVVLALSIPASAISLIYEPGSGALTGTPFLGGGVTFKISNVDVGTLYPAGTAGGYSGLPESLVPGGVSGGVLALDSLGAPPAGTLAGYATRGHGDTLEDTWGIARVTEIQDTATELPIWTQGFTSEQITVIFYGEQDFFIGPGEDPAEDRICGVGLRADFYHQPLGPSDYSSAGGTAARTAVDEYPTVADTPPGPPSPLGGTEGVLMLQAESIPGHINGPGEGGGLATEFQSNFDFTNFKGDGASMMKLIDAREGTSPYMTRDFMQFNGDAFTPLASALAAGITTPGDLSIAFDTDPYTGVADWLVTSNDPLLTTSIIPEPVTMAGLMLGFGSLVGYVRRRRK